MKKIKFEEKVEADNSMNGSIESSSKASDMSSNDILLEYKNKIYLQKTLLKLHYIYFML